VIELSGVSKALDGKRILREVSLVVHAGERLVVMGTSGSGKTTLLRLVAGLLTPDEGSLSISGRLVARDGQNVVPPERRDVGMVFQDLALWPHLTVRGNLAFGLRARGVARDERERRIGDMLARVGLEARGGARPTRLSGGEQQRVALARALVLNPKILLMDEPLSSLDEELRVQMRDEILRLHREMGFTLLYVTHSREEVADMATRSVRIRAGRVEDDV
jgi:iron(III) transport system ATP-binding protein